MANVRLRIPYSFQKAVEAPMLIDTTCEIKEGLLELDPKTHPGVVELARDGQKKKNLAVLLDGIPLKDPNPELSEVREITLVPIFGDTQ